MRQYLDMVQNVLAEGMPRMSRTGERTLGMFGGTFWHKMTDGFPLITTKEVNFKAVAAELLGFIHGADSAATFRQFGTKIWDANANDPGRPEAPNAWLKNPHRKGPDDLGRIYGVQWRESLSVQAVESAKVAQAINRIQDQGDEASYLGEDAERQYSYVGRRVDQLKRLIDGIRKDPFGRRHIVSAWNPGELDQMALPPCHVMFQCYVHADVDGTPQEISLQMYQRSADLFLGVPFNIASYALLLSMIGHVTDLRPKLLGIHFGDLHIYESHIPEMLVQVRRTPGVLPTLRIGTSQSSVKGDASKPISYFVEDKPYGRYDDAEFVKVYRELDDFKTVDAFQMSGYHSQGRLSGKMSV